MTSNNSVVSYGNGDIFTPRNAEELYGRKGGSYSAMYNKQRQDNEMFQWGFVKPAQHHEYAVDVVTTR